MTKKERKEQTLRQQELLVEYQLVSDFVRQLSGIYERAGTLFAETVNSRTFCDAVEQLRILKDKYLAG